MALIPSGAGRPHGANPGGAGGGCDHWPPKRLGLRGAEEGNVNSPACRAVGMRRAASEQKGASNKGSPGPVDLAMYSSAFFIEEKRFTSEWMPRVWGCASFHDE